MLKEEFTVRKVLVLIVAAFLVALGTETSAFAAAPAKAPAARPVAETIGVVDSIQVSNSHPALKSTREKLAALYRQKDSEATAAAERETDPAKKAQVVQAKRLEYAQEEQKLMEPIARDCDQAVRTVAKNKNLTIVVSSAFVLYGGVDITQDVIQQLTKKK